MRRLRFYHASPRRFRRGQVLTGRRGGGYGCAHESVCMTDSPLPHVSVCDRAVAEKSAT